MQERFAMRSWAMPYLHPVVCATSGKKIFHQWTILFYGYVEDDIFYSYSDDEFETHVNAMFD